MKRKRNMAQMKGQIKTPEKELSKIELTHLSHAEFKTLVIRMLRDLFEYSKHLREEMKAILSEIKKNPQGTNSEGKEAKVQIKELEHKEEINSQPEQKEETIIPKNEERIRRLGDISKCAHIHIIGMPEGEEKSKIQKTYLKKIMKENVPNFVKEIDIQVQEAQRVPNKMYPKRTMPRHIVIKLPKVKDKERILKAAREKQRVAYE